MMKGNILIVDDNAAIRSTLELLLPPYFEKILTIPSPNQLSATLHSHPDIDVILLDMNFHTGVNNGNEGIFWLREIKKLKPNISVVLFTAYADVPLAVKAIKEGAVDFIEKPWNNERIILTLQNAAALARKDAKISALQNLRSNPNNMIWGDSPKMQELKSLIERIAPTDANILITGENGTGKEMLAQEIHSLSHRKNELLVPVDMGAITETLFESELFGHAKGSFTDAKKDKPGKFETASGGSLFLDEIANLPLHLQSKLLVALQSRSITRLGETKSRPINVRLISATNANIELLVENGAFREDLLYRINTFCIELPPLRERTEDIIPLALFFLEKYARKYNKKCNAISASAQQKLIAHNWKGNIRELQHAIEKAIILSDSNTIKHNDLLLNKSVQKNSNLSMLTLDEIEKNAIIKTINKHNGNLSETASTLGITRQTLYNKLKKYNI